MTDTEVTAKEVLRTLPGSDRVGDVDHWQIYSYGELIKFHAKFLGYSSSQRDRHELAHRDQGWARPDEKCAACRWFEPRIFREVSGQNRYLLHRSGVSIVPGESVRTRHEWLLTAHEVVESLTTRRRSRNAPTKCPVCDGTGLVSRPPGVAGDQPLDGKGPYECGACQGSKILFSDSVYLTVPAARVLSQAAGQDDDMDDAWVNRATA